MNAPIASEAGLNLGPEVDKFMAKIIRKSGQLKSSGLTLDDRENLKERLRFTWTEAPDDNLATAVTAWRKTTARKAYRAIQDASDHLFLAVILAITPTECSKPSFKKVKELLLSLKSYEVYQTNMDFEEKHHFESTAAEQGFINNRRYLDFMNAIFPQGQQSYPFMIETGLKYK